MLIGVAGIVAVIGLGMVIFGIYESLLVAFKGSAAGAGIVTGILTVGIAGGLVWSARSMTRR